MDKYTVELRIEGEALDPSQVSEVFGLTPTHSRCAGEPRGQSFFGTSLWAYAGDDASSEWDCIEDGLIHLMQEFDPKAGLIRRYAAEYKVYWWCGHFQSSFDGGPMFSPALLKRLAEFGVPLLISNYFCEDEASQV